MTSTYTYDQIKAVIKASTGQANVITTPRAFIKFTGDHISAMLLAQIVYWSDRTDDPSGWFYKTDQDWAEELCLSSYQVRRATTRLAELGVEHAVRRHSGAPTSHYRLNFDTFIPLFLKSLENEETSLSEMRVSSKSKMRVSRISSINTNPTPPPTTMSESDPTTDNRQPTTPSGACAPGGGGSGKKPKTATFSFLRSIGVSRGKAEAFSDLPLEWAQKRWASISAGGGGVGALVADLEDSPPATNTPPPAEPAKPRSPFGTPDYLQADRAGRAQMEQQYTLELNRWKARGDAHAPR
jgi:hypothetical protein